MKTTTLTVCLYGLTVFTAAAQGPPPQPPAPAVNAVKEALNLTDGQLTQLRQVQQNRIQANRQLQDQIAERQRTLDQTLRQSAPDAVTVGNLVLDANKLRKQIRINDETYRGMAANVLTADQKKKLQDLENALKLRPAIEQALGLGLLAPPADQGPGAGPMGFGSRRPPGGGDPMRNRWQGQRLHQPLN
ncbi:MAG: periplasmic heavy metal sensor [Bryobacterales bacterium]|nr:periplasmic heavy metal sensor [Bryobacterales bacterium]